MWSDWLLWITAPLFLYLYEICIKINIITYYHPFLWMSIKANCACNQSSVRASMTCRACSLILWKQSQTSKHLEAALGKTAQHVAWKCKAHRERSRPFILYQPITQSQHLKKKKKVQSRKHLRAVVYSLDTITLLTFQTYRTQMSLTASRGLSPIFNVERTANNPTSISQQMVSWNIIPVHNLLQTHSHYLQDRSWGCRRMESPKSFAPQKWSQQHSLVRFL